MGDSFVIRTAPIRASVRDFESELASYCGNYLGFTYTDVS